MSAQSPQSPKPPTLPKRVRLADIARGMIAAVPEMGAVTRGLTSMALVRPTAKRSIGRVLEHWAHKTPDAPALSFEGRTWTYGSFNAWANRLAHTFADAGIGRGDTVGILMTNRPEALAAVAATVKLGAVAGLLNYNQRGEVLAHSIQLVQPALMVADHDCHEALDSAGFGPADAPCLMACDAGQHPPDGWNDLGQASDHQPGSNPDSNPDSTGTVTADMPCFYIFTSGTTGLPKASVMTHYRWLSSMGGLGGATLRLRGDDVFYVCLPLYHNNALTVSWSAVMSAGACLALDRKFSATQFWDRIRATGATGFCYIGELLRYLLNQPPTPDDRNHRVRLITGNGLRPEIWSAFQTRFGIQRIYEFYGSSEGNIAFINAFGVERTAGFAPMTFAIVEYDVDRDAPVRDHKDRLKKVSSGGVGLLISKVTSTRPFDGYTDPQATASKLMRDVFRRGDCWFNTGDLVRDQGWKHIQFVDRVGDTFRWKGENVACGEVEGAVADDPGIDHAVVYGVEIPGHDGRAGMAAITLAEHADFDGEALARRLRAALPGYAVPLFLRVRGEQDTTGTFKYRKVDLKREGFDPGTVHDPLYWLTDDGYAPLTDSVYQDITAGGVRL